MLGLAVELQRRGHHVTFATNEHFESTIKKYGLPFVALGTEEAFIACIQNPDLWRPRQAFGHLIRTLKPILKRQYDIHAGLAADGSLVAITNCFGFGALMAQDKIGVPVVTLHCQPAVLWSDRAPPTIPGMFGPAWLKKLIYRFGERYILDPIGCPFLNEWRNELGLAPMQKITRWWHSRFGVLCMFPEWYCPPQADWPDQVMQTSFPLWNDRSDDPLAKDVESFLGAGDAPIVFTPGSANIHGQRFFESAVDACRRLGRRGILLTEFPEQLPHPLPDWMAHYRYVPLDRLLPRAAAFVHHGGIGSTSQAMLAGIPQVLMPLAHDQFDNAARIRRLGIGESIKASSFSGRRLAATLKRLFVSPIVRDSCRRIAIKVAARDGISRSADAVEARVGKSFSN